MPKVYCVVCSETGFTASPDYVRCECGGKLVEISNAKDVDHLKKLQNGGTNNDYTSSVK